MVHTKNKEDYLNELSKSFKDYLKKNPQKKRKRIVKKNRDGSVTIDNDFTLAYLKKGERLKVELKVTAMPDAWKKIESFSLNNPNWFGLEFHSHFANPAVLETRRKQKKSQYFINEIKIHSGALFAFLKYWCRQPVKEWPEYLGKILDLCKRDEGYSLYIKTQKGDYDPIALTEYCISKVFKDSIQALGLKPFDDPSNFYITYIQDQKRPQGITKGFIKGKTPQEIASLAYTIPALEFVFRTLEVF